MQVLAQWIGNTLLVQQAKAKKLYPSDQELNSRLEAVKNQIRFAGMELEDQLRQQGRDMASFKEEQLSAMVQENVFFEGVDVTDAELRQAFDTQKQSFTIPEQVRISQITLDSEKAKNDAQNELASGAQFSLVATTRSKDPFAANGGQVPMPLPRQAERGGPVSQEAIDAAFKLKPGQTSDPVKVGATWVIVKLEEKIEEKAPEFDQFRELIRSGMRSQKAQQTGKQSQNQQQFLQSASGADIKINRPEYQALLNQFKAPVPPAGAPMTGDSGIPPPPPGG
jgi:parvulin-like peptidyl-prolyl isomerase